LRAQAAVGTQHQRTTAQPCCPQLLRDGRYGKPAWISFSCADDSRTCAGEPLAAAVRALRPAVAEGLVAAVGVNCTAPRHVPVLLETARQGAC
jgi:S-methylmethionine-dependent homocysteine/selenocysteine methylase